MRIVSPVWLCLTLAVAGALTSVARTVVPLGGAGWTCDRRAVEIPHCWSEPRSAVYSRPLPTPTKGKRQFLRFEGVSQKARVYVNHKIVCSHVGAFGAFACEITAALKEDGNLLDVGVDNLYDADMPPANRCDYTIFGGIYRNVWFIETDASCIDPTFWGGPGVQVRADAAGRIRVAARLSGTNAAARVTYRIVETGDEFTGAEFACGSPRPWTPETPNVYHLEATLKDGESSDSVTVPFGFRTAEFRDEGFFLNDVRRKLRGVNRHQEREGRDWALQEGDARADLALIREMGADAVRTAHYPNADEVYALCDEMGLLAWCELPLTGGVTPGGAYAHNLAMMQCEMVEQLGNHPSVFVWSVFNEIAQEGDNVPNAGLPFVVDANAFFRLLDPTRPTVAATSNAGLGRINSTTDALAANLYPGWYDGSAADFAARIGAYFTASGRPSLGVSEYGAGASTRHHESPGRRPEPKGRFHPEEYQALLHHDIYRQIAADDRIWGSFVWCMFDFASRARHEGERDGINDKGLVTRDRRERKDAWWFYRANWNSEPVLHLVGTRMKETAAESVTVIGFCNAGEVTLTVNGAVVGVQRPDAVKSVIWRDVKLAEGRNLVELKSGGLHESCVWIFRQKMNRR